LLAGLNPEVDSQLSRKVAAVYLFVFRTLMEATGEKSPEKLHDALRVLEVERETWRQMCDKLGEDQSTEESQTPETTAPPHFDDSQLGENSGLSEPSSGGFSLEA